VVHRPCIRSRDVRPAVTQDNAVKGKWVRVAPDLNQETSMTYLVSTRSRLRDPSLINNPIRTSITVSLVTEPKLRPGVKSRNLYPTRGTRFPYRRFGSPVPLVQSRDNCWKMIYAERKNDLIIELGVTYGEDIPWYSFDRLSPPTTPEIKSKRQGVHITFRRGVRSTSLAKPFSVECVAKQSARPPSGSSPAFLMRREIPYPPGRRFTLLCLPRRLSRHHHLPM
jgi:hypothetical protein